MIPTQPGRDRFQTICARGIIATVEANQKKARRELIEVGRWMASQGWLPATSGNLSIRLSAKAALVTKTGTDKSRLSITDFLVASIAWVAPPGASAEAPLHLRLYRERPDVGAILHGHSIASTLLSQAHAGTPAIDLTGYELSKAFAGVTTHEATVHIPLVPNGQDLDAVAALVSQRLETFPEAVCCLLEGHGFYAWGRDVREAQRHAEALDFLLRCEWERRRMR